MFTYDIDTVDLGYSITGGISHITDLKITAEAVEILSINYDFLHHFVFFTTSKKRPSNNKASASCA